MVHEPDDAQFLQQEFPLTSVTRADLLAAGCSRARVLTLTDEDMRAIAAKIAAIYCENGLWEDIRFVTDLYLLERSWRAGTE